MLKNLDIHLVLLYDYAAVRCVLGRGFSIACNGTDHLNVAYHFSYFESPFSSNLLLLDISAYTKYMLHECLFPKSTFPTGCKIFG